MPTFRGSTLFALVATAALTGARLGELLALRWSDLDVPTRALRIERAIEVTRAGRRIKPPKSARGVRSFKICDELISVLMVERERHLRIVAGVGDAADVDLSLVRLPADALMFPSPAGEVFDFTRTRNPRSVTNETRARFRALGFPKLRFHDLRGSHGTALLDAGVPVHVVAARLGHDPAILLRNYTKVTPAADDAAADATAALAKGLL